MSDAVLTPAPETEILIEPEALTSGFSFADLPPAMTAALEQQGITDPTPVQSAVIPDALAGHDVLGRARTGSGKTLAFGIPALAQLAGSKSRHSHPRAVVVVPTRELANQVTRSLSPLAESLDLKLTTVYGGTPYEKQIRQLRQRADIVVATPGRLEDLFENGYVFFDDIQVTILDEADHLCDLGFFPIVDKLVGLTPAGTQRMLLSATLDGEVDTLVKRHLRNPRLHELDPNSGAVTTMAHHTLVVGGFKEKIAATGRLIEANGKAIVFTRTKQAAMDLAEALTTDGVDAVDLHGDLSQKVRERNLHRFSSGVVQAIVATDVAARGIHVDDVDLVVHFDSAGDAKAYLHRSGRTARAGKEGCVVTITTPKFQSSVVRMQQDAGVEVLHHDLRTAPRELTADALAESGHPGPIKSAGGSGSGKRPYTKRPQGERRYGDQKPGERKYGSRPQGKAGQGKFGQREDRFGAKSGSRKPFERSRQG